MPKKTKISNTKKVRNYDLENVVAVDINSDSKEIEPAIEMGDNDASSSTIGDKAINNDSRDIEPSIEISDNDASSFPIKDKSKTKEERIARRLIAKLGLERIHGVKQVLMRNKTKQSIFAINNPDVYKHPATDNYIIFGEPLVEDNILKAQQRAAAKKARDAKMLLDMLKRRATNTSSIAQEDEEKNEEEDKEEIDYKGANKNYVNLVCEQTKVNKQEAIEALLKNDNDLLTTMVELTL